MKIRVISLFYPSNPYILICKLLCIVHLENIFNYCLKNAFGMNFELFRNLFMIFVICLFILSILLLGKWLTFYHQQLFIYYSYMNVTLISLNNKKHFIVIYESIINNIINKCFLYTNNLKYSYF